LEAAYFGEKRKKCGTGSFMNFVKVDKIKRCKGGRGPTHQHNIKTNISDLWYANIMMIYSLNDNDR